MLERIRRLSTCRLQQASLVQGKIAENITSDRESLTYKWQSRWLGELKVSACTPDSQLKELQLSGHSAFHQWGFRPGHSTSSALTTIIDDWLKSMELGKSVCSVFLNVRKAFDSVPHTILVNKLQSHGLNVYLLRWICDYLSDREQCTNV